MFKRTVLLVTHDEHGGLYDHVPPPTGVPSPGGAPSSVGRLMRLLLYRKARAFDFTMLGPRVPAVVISPLVPAGIVDPQTHDHASIPATLRRLFAPGASPLTRRDAWSAPFHGLLTLPVARTDLPDLSDLSAYATGLTAAVSTAAVSTPSAAAAPAAVEPTAPPAVPASYQAFTALAEQVQQHLVAVGEPEATGAPPTGGPVERSAQISRTFAAAAHRHRHEAGRPARPAAPENQ